MLPKKLEELIKLERTQANFRKIINVSILSVDKLYYQELASEIEKIIAEIKNILDLDIKDMVAFLSSMEIIYDVQKNIPEDVLKMFSEFSKEQENLYHQKIRKNPLFKKIMACMDLNVIENEMGIDLSIPTLQDYSIYDLNNKIDEWSKKIEDKFLNKQISSEEKEQYTRKIAYIGDYYWSIINNSQDEYNKIILSRVRGKTL